MKADDPILENTIAIELWRHDAEEEGDVCHLGLYFRSDGNTDVYEMRMGDHIIPLHPGFPMGYPLAAHCLLHIAQEFYAGNLVNKEKLAESSLLDGWTYEEENS